MCSRQIIFLAATASKAWAPLSVAVAGDVSYVLNCSAFFYPSGVLRGRPR